MIVAGIVYLAIVAQMVGWAWLMKNAGHLSDRKFLVFTLMMVAGQIGQIIDGWGDAWGVVGCQAFFLATTVYGGIKRLTEMRTRPDAASL